MKNIELLAPAGNMDAFISAIDAGADAVYIGGEHFSARAFSNNFSLREIEKAVEYAHLRNVRVFVAVNTLILTSEWEACIQFIDDLYYRNVDAVIIQDFGLLNYAIKRYPDMEIHASTQMTIDSVEGVLQLQDLGVDRVVLAREMSIEEIREVRKETDIPLEVFVSGALCTSYSGQCLMSSFIGGRSGNRGTCSQNCRKNYKFKKDGEFVETEGDYLLSSKDLFVLDDLFELVQLGNISLKVEGRMKRSEYVKKVISIFRSKLDAKDISEIDIKELKSLFNREFTKGHLFGDYEINPFRPNHLGIPLGTILKDFYIKLIDDLHQGDGIRVIGHNEFGLTVNKMEIDGLLVNHASKGDIVRIHSKYHPTKGDHVVKTTDVLLLDKINKQTLFQKYPIYFEVSYCENDLEINCFDDDGVYVYYSESILEKSEKNHSKRLQHQLSKSGDYPFEIEVLGDLVEVYAKSGDINRVRRTVIDLYTKKKLKRERVINDVGLEPIKIEMTEEVVVSVLNVEQLTGKYPEYSRVIDVLPIQARARKIKYSAADGIISNISGLKTYKAFSTNFSFNVTNPYTVYYLHKLGAKKVCLSLELNKHQIIELEKTFIEVFKQKPNIEIICYGRPESMIIKHELEEGLLVDTHKEEYKVVRDELSTIYHSKTIDLIGRLDEIPKMNYRLDFTFESEDEVEDVLNRFEKEQKFNNYYGHFDLGI